jgi:ketosteroid isomerase-like protein
MKKDKYKDQFKIKLFHLKKIVLDFVDAINKADIEKLGELMTDEHVFIDSQDNRMTGREKMKHAWNEYYKLFPDYQIEINEVFQNESLICLTGYASGTYMNLKDAHWRIPAAWTAKVMDNKISEWKVIADNSVVLDIINRNN